jgi:hypothetical protein
MAAAQSQEGAGLPDPSFNVRWHQMTVADQQCRSSPASRFRISQAVVDGLAQVAAAFSDDGPPRHVNTPHVVFVCVHGLTVEPASLPLVRGPFDSVFRRLRSFLSHHFARRGSDSTQQGANKRASCGRSYQDPKPNPATATRGDPELDH